MWLSFDKETVEALEHLLARKDLVFDLPADVSVHLAGALETITKAKAAHVAKSRATFIGVASEIASHTEDVKVDPDAVVEVSEDDMAEAFVMAWIHVQREDDGEDEVDLDEEEVVDDEEGSPFPDSEEE